MDNALYALIPGRPIAWMVIDFADGYPRMVPVGQWDADGEYKAVPVTGGQTWMPNWNDAVIYAPDLETIVRLILDDSGPGAA